MSTEIFSRDLSYKEKMATLTYQKTLIVKEYMTKNIDLDTLSFPERVKYNLFKKSCVPTSILLDKIENETEKYPDQAASLITLHKLCTDGTLSLAEFYVNQADDS